MDEAAVRALPWEGVVPLEQVLRYALPPYGGDTLPEAIAALRQNPAEVEIVGVLAAELSASADMLFEEPVRVYFIEPADWDAVDQAEYGARPIQPKVGNGMHRLAAAVVAGAERIRVTMQDWDSINPPFDDELIELSYLLHGAPAPSYMPHGGDAVEFGFAWLRSFRLTPDAWVEAAVSGSCNGVVTSIYYCPHRLRQELVQTVTDRAGLRGMRLEVVRARGVTWDQLDEEDSDA